jgi:acid phosphatase family membrane protein YuiD
VLLLCRVFSLLLVCLQVLMVVCYFAAQQIDVIIAKQQRRQLGLCEECGGMYSADSCKQGNCPMKAKASR